MKPFYEQKKPVWVTHPKQLDFPPHLHDAVEIVYLLGGASTVACDSGRLALLPGDIFLSFPNQVHGYENTRDFEGYVLIATTASLPAYKATLEQNQPAVPVIHPTGSEAEEIVTLLKMMFGSRIEAQPPMLQGYAMVLFSKVLKMTELTPRSAGADAQQAILHYIGEHYREPITRGDIARAVGYSEGYVSHIFADCLNTTLTGYITMLRMDEARRLLRETSLPVGRIAMQLGFSSIRSFNRFFAKEMNTTPTAYRASRR